jgi:TRAP-type C4-dicarboxylate transport system permease small subunit
MNPSCRSALVLRWWSGVVRLLEASVMVLMATLVLVVLWGILSRYLPGIRPSDWTEELAIYLLVWLSLLGAALAYRSHAHLGVDYFVGRLDAAARQVAAVVVELVVFGFSVFALVLGGWRLVAETLASHQTTPVLQWAAGYLYLAAPLSGVFFCAFAVEHLLRRSAFGGERPRGADL